MTKFFLFEVQDSDGNDCTVYDAIVSADTRELASDKLWKELSAWYPRDESDGGYGTYHACDCVCEHRKKSICARCSDSWECSHGGLTTNEEAESPYGPAEFASYADALAEHARYHCLIDLSE